MITKARNQNVVNLLAYTLLVLSLWMLILFLMLLSSMLLAKRIRRPSLVWIKFEVNLNEKNSEK